MHQKHQNLLDSYLKPNQPYIIFDYGNIRPKGQPLKTFGGVSSGYEILNSCINRIRE